MIWCQISEGHLEEAEHQLEFLKEVQQSMGKSEVSSFWGQESPRDGILLGVAGSRLQHLFPSWPHCSCRYWSSCKPC